MTDEINDVSHRSTLAKHDEAVLREAATALCADCGRSIDGPTHATYCATVTSDGAATPSMRSALEEIENIAARPISGTSLQTKANRFDVIRKKARTALGVAQPSLREAAAGTSSVSLELERAHLITALVEIMTNAEDGSWTLPSSFGNRARTALNAIPPRPQNILPNTSPVPDTDNG